MARSKSKKKRKQLQIHLHWKNRLKRRKQKTEKDNNQKFIKKEQYNKNNYNKELIGMKKDKNIAISNKYKMAVVNTQSTWKYNEEYATGGALKFFETRESIKNKLLIGEEIYIFNNNEKKLRQKCKIEKIEKDGVNYIIYLNDIVIINKFFNKNNCVSLDRYSLYECLITE